MNYYSSSASNVAVNGDDIINNHAFDSCNIMLTLK